MKENKRKTFFSMNSSPIREKLKRKKDTNWIYTGEVCSKRQKTFKWYSIVFKWVKIKRWTPPFWILCRQPPLWWDEINSCFPFVSWYFVWINLREQKQFDSGYEPVYTENEIWKCEISLLQTWTLVISLVMATQTPSIRYNFGMPIQFTSYIEFMLLGGGFCTTEVVSKESWKLFLSCLFWVTLLITVNRERYGLACMFAIFELAWCGNSAAVHYCLYVISYYYALQLKGQGWNFISETIVRSNPSGSNLSCFICLSTQSSPKAYAFLFRCQSNHLLYKSLH